MQFNVVLTKILTSVKLQKPVLKFILKRKCARVAKTLLKKDTFEDHLVI